jgi:hypothetical protein
MLCAVVCVAVVSTVLCVAAFTVAAVCVAVGFTVLGVAAFVAAAVCVAAALLVKRCRSRLGREALSAALSLDLSCAAMCADRLGWGAPALVVVCTFVVCIGSLRE